MSAQAWVTDEPIDVARVEAAVTHPGAGAVVIFHGVIRNHDHDRPVHALEYLGHPSAQDVLAEVVRQFAAEASVFAVAAAHRVGSLEIGDAALVAAVSTAHRADAFAICGRLVDEIKTRLPVWKRQVFADGTDEWVNCP